MGSWEKYLLECRRDSRFCLINSFINNANRKKNRQRLKMFSCHFSMPLKNSWRPLRHDSFEARLNGFGKSLAQTSSTSRNFIFSVIYFVQSHQVMFSENGKLDLKLFRNYHFFYFIRFSTSWKLLTQWRYDLQVSLSKIFVWNPRDHLNVLCVFNLGHAHTVCWWWPLFSKHVKTKCKLESFQITSY